MATSFVKKTTTRGRTNLPPGTKPSLQNNQLLISTGVPSLDAYIEEDIHSSYSNVLQKCFIAEAVVAQQEIYIASADKNPEDIFKETPCLADEETELKNPNDSNDLMIAWRYKDRPKVQAIISSQQFGHYFDLSKTISQEKINLSKLTCFYVNPNRQIYSGEQYKKLLESVKNKLKSFGSCNTTLSSSVLRICICSLGSPLWSDSNITSDSSSALPWFLLALRSLLRSSFAACMITMPTHLFEEPWFVSRIERCCDTVVRIQSFSDSVKDQNFMYKDYNGLLHVVKLAHLNCIAGHDINTSDLGFKLKRKKFSIEKLHLPPNIGETVNRLQRSIYVMQQLASTFLKTAGDASVVIKSSIAAIFFSYLLALIPGTYEALSITPSLLLPPNFQVWTLITGILVEASIVNVIFDIPMLVYCGRIIEPLWGALELLKYIALTGIGTALLTSFVSLAAYASTQNYDLWSVRFSGGAGVIGGLLVAFKQVIPEQKVKLKLKDFYVQELPFLCVMVYVFLSVVRIFSYTQPIMVTCGIIVGWSYLRFYQPRGRGMRGDMSESFEFASLLPAILRFPVRFISNNLFNLMVKVGICTHPVKTYDVGAPSSITISLPGSDPIDAERRRKKALRALNERLVRMKKTPDNEDNWPTIEDELKKTESIKDTSPLTDVSEPEKNLKEGEIC